MRACPTPVDILLVEDSPSDAILTREALREARLVNTLEVVTRGEDALAYLYDEGRSHPDLVLLDLSLPGISGLDVLARMKDDPRLREIPVIVLTTSAADSDVTAAYRSHVNAYVRKPVDFDEFMRAVTRIGDFWLSLVTLPEHA